VKKFVKKVLSNRTDYSILARQPFSGILKLYFSMQRQQDIDKTWLE